MIDVIYIERVNLIWQIYAFKQYVWQPWQIPRDKVLARNLWNGWRYSIIYTHL